MAIDRRIAEQQRDMERKASAGQEGMRERDLDEERRDGVEQRKREIHDAAIGPLQGAVRRVEGDGHRIDLKSDADVVEGAIRRPGDGVETGADDADYDRDYQDKNTPA